MANSKRFHERCQREFEAFRKERLASGELECQKLINAAQAHLTQVQREPYALRCVLCSKCSCPASHCPGFLQICHGHIRAASMAFKGSFHGLHF